VPLPVPKQHEFFGKDQGLRIKDLVDPTKKMSKSDETGRGVLFMSDSPETAAKKVMSATTDSFGEIKYDLNDRERAGIANLLQILALLSERPLQDVVAEWEGKTSYGDLKKAVAEVVADFLRDFQNRLQAVDDQAIVSKLEASEAAMQEVTNATLLRAQKAVGLRA
jgi:tryptophanyl-tRNA synthetase